MTLLTNMATSMVRGRMMRASGAALAAAPRHARMYHEKVLDHYNNPRNVRIPTNDTRC